ncbi:D-alanyl-D-alanine carboxypeptidase family protein [Bacillus sp. S/N-304-OC-R1]|uniref:D-alanyl-D-alanine carboxypeptidase family protein n=1 Tax=Bacillus sp. S/N-304-OC-R1 TaxID=2758034 RepID=UPI001C8D8F9E|nr:D-alanyl-D-alanine carboxypeptidase family protein [Bacillus sp. S/N-304-OC-R1]MBY0120386.1 D-alanyl-D-alanine carboxypeptidase [Bacillus sp. S/N-304-OC-R1]
MNKIILIMLIIFSFCVPVGTIVHAEELSNPEVRSEAAIIVDSETGAVLYEKNAEQRMYPASLTKIATAIYAIENGNLEDMVTVSKNAANTDGTSVYLEEGEQVPLKKLIQGMLINSGNDAAAAIAEHLDGSHFEEKINEYLKTKIHVSNTHFTNPHGLFDENHYTTAEDLAKITSYALKNDIFREIYGTKELKWIGKSWDTTLLTHHLMLKGEIPYEAVNGGKTGYVPESKFTLATSAQKDNMELTAIVLKGVNDKEVYDDTISLLDYGFDQFKHTYIPKSDTFQKEGKTFTTGLYDVLITVPASSYENIITSDGQLQVTNTNGNIIQAVTLVEKPVEKTDTRQEKVEQPSDRKTMGFYGKYAIILTAVAGLLIGIRKLKKR